MTHRSTYLYIFICLTVALTFYQFYRVRGINQYHYKSHLYVCSKARKFQLHYLGPSLTHHFTDQTELVLCPGDAFGDLSDTYIMLEQECFLTMRHQGKILWSSEKPSESDDGLRCAAALEKDGNFVIYKERFISTYSYQKMPPIFSPAWDSKTEFHPNKTELRVESQQLQIVQTFQDGSERMFYTAANIRGGFREYLGPPKQVAENSLLKNHNNDLNGSIILRRNEYIGNLNGLHLILQTNCELQLNNGQPIWSFVSDYRFDHNCTLSVQGGNSIGIPGRPERNYYLHNDMKILPDTDFKVVQSKIILQNGEILLIVQTLEDGSEVTFYSEPGQNNGLKLKKELKQIAKNSIIIPSKTEVFLNRMEYIGDLAGLHLILQNNCELVLENGKQELWKLEKSPIFTLDPPYMECFIQFNGFALAEGVISFDRMRNNRDRCGIQIFGSNPTFIRRLPAKFQLSLENDMMIINLKYKTKAPEIHYAGKNTHGTWLQFLSDTSLTINANAKEDKILPELGYIGDLNGVYAVLNAKGNFILYNKTRVIWESGTSREHEHGYALILARDGNVAVSGVSAVLVKEFYLWSTETTNAYKKSQLRKSVLYVNPNGMWLANTYIDGTVKKFKALEGTNRFVLVKDE